MGQSGSLVVNPIGEIPRTLHQVWVGPHDPPIEMLKTWTEAHPTWNHVLWTNPARPECRILNQGFDFSYGLSDWPAQRAIDELVERGQWSGVADVIRYCALALFGGIALDADSVCRKPLDDLLDFPFSAWAAWEHEKRHPGLVACGAMGSSPFHPVFKEAVRRLSQGGLPKGNAWETVGPWFLTRLLGQWQAWGGEWHNWPARFFFPRHYSGLPAPGALSETFQPYAEQYWGSTRKGLTTDLPITVLTTGGPGFERWIADCVSSVHVQTVPHEHLIILGDEKAANAAQHAVEATGSRARVTLTRRHSYLDSLEVLRAMYPPTVVVDLDGDDAFFRADALEIIGAAHGSGAWMTYGSFRAHPDLDPPYWKVEEYDPKLFEKLGGIRSRVFGLSHARSYRAGLWQRIPRDRYESNGSPLMLCTDLLKMLDMAELCGTPERCRFVPETLYLYRTDNPTSLDNASEERRLARMKQTEMIMGRPPLRRLFAEPW